MNLVLHSSVSQFLANEAFPMLPPSLQVMKLFISVFKNTQCCDVNSKEITRSKLIILDAETEWVRTHSLRNSDSSTIYPLTLFLKTIKIYRIKAARAIPYFLSDSF